MVDAIVGETPTRPLFGPAVQIRVRLHKKPFGLRYRSARGVLPVGSPAALQRAAVRRRLLHGNAGISEIRFEVTACAILPFRGVRITRCRSRGGHSRRKHAQESSGRRKPPPHLDVIPRPMWKAPGSGTGSRLSAHRSRFSVGSRALAAIEVKKCRICY